MLEIQEKRIWDALRSFEPKNQTKFSIENLYVLSLRNLIKKAPKSTEKCLQFSVCFR